MKCRIDSLTADELRAILHYDPDTGQFTRLRSQCRWKAGTVAGRTDPTTGYVRITVDGRLHYAHRLAWLYVHGDWPEHRLDHHDLCRSNNRLENLRPADDSLNKANMLARADNSSGFKGISLNKKTRRWRAKIVVRGQRFHLGCHATPEAAHAAYQTAARQHFGEFARF